MLIQKTLVAKAAGADPLEYIMSDATVDRYGDVVEPKGWDIQAFQANPIALFGHKSDFIIGHWKDVKVAQGALRGRLQLMERGISERLDEVIAAVQAGILRAVSVGFRPVEAEPRKEGGNYYKKQSLVECSLVSIPANPNALQIAKQLHLSPETQDLIFGKPADEDGVVRRGTNGVSASINIPLKAKPMSLAQKIAAAEADVVALRDQITDLVAKEDDDETELVQLDELNTRLEAKQNTLDMLKR